MSYLGCKGASGAYQAVIAAMPAHDTYIDAYLGTGLIFNRKAPALRSIGIDIDEDTLSCFETDKEIEIYNTDALKFLLNFDHKSNGRVFVYADPPYLPSTRTSKNKYRHDYTEKNHIDFLNTMNILSSRGIMVMISGYPSKLYDDHLKAWRTYEYQVMTRGGVRTEKLWMNYPEDSVYWASYAGKDYQKRQGIKRKAERWAKKYKALSNEERVAVMAALLSADS